MIDDELFKAEFGAMGSDTSPESSYGADTITLNSIPPLTSLDISKLTAMNYNINTMSSGSAGSSSTYNPYNITTGKITIGTASGVNGSWGNSYYTNGTTHSSPGSLKVTGDADFEGDVKIKGVSIAKMLEQIQDRLAILVPDPKKLEKYEALKKAYNHYKLMEKLIGDDSDVDE